jgi:hypothetical protein
MKGNKHIQTFEQHQENLNISDVRSSKINTFKIETSIGIIEIPEDAINKYVINNDDEWVSKLRELYDFVSIYTDSEREGWLFIELSNFRGESSVTPEHKIIY